MNNTVLLACAVLAVLTMTVNSWSSSPNTATTSSFPPTTVTSTVTYAWPETTATTGTSTSYPGKATIGHFTSVEAGDSGSCRVELSMVAIVVFLMVWCFGHDA